jgi:uncharacterized protein (TIGR03546 family)
MILIKLISKLLKALNAGASPSEIAGGVVLGSIIGITPTFSLHNLLILILIIVIKVNVSAAIFSSILFGILGYAIDPLSNIIGEKLLLADNLNGMWTTMYNMPVIPLTRFNNTVVLGSVVISIILVIPLFIFTKKFVIVYRTRVQEKVEKLKVVKILKASKIYKIYARFK